MAQRACIFDLDGTLLDSLGDLADAGNAVLREAGYPTHPDDAYRFFAGSGMDTLLRRALPPGEDRRLPPDALQRLCAAVRAVYGRAWHARSRLYPGIPAMIDRLRRAGVSLAILSNKPDPNVRAIVDHYFPRTPFAVVRGALPDVPLKPDPQSALAVAGALGLTPDRCLFVGDSAVDMRTGRNAGMAVLGVCWGFRPREELLEAGATALAATPDDVVAQVLEANL